jgi:von Willebrand factor type A domain
MRILQLTKLLLVVGVFSVISYGQENIKVAKKGQILLNINALNEFDEPINDLKSENFNVFIDKKPVEILSFNSENSPASIGFLIDNSRSMEGATDLSREGIITFLEASNPKNEYFVSAFNREVKPLSDFTDSEEMKKIISNNPYLLEMPKNGGTVMYDAIIAGIEKLAQSKNRKKVLFVFWDAGDTYSLGNYKKVEKLVKEKNIIVYSIAYDDQALVEGQTDELAEISGGAAIYSSGRAQKLKTIVYRSKYYSPYELFLLDFSKIADQLQHQYTIGFNPDLDGDKNKWRKLEVKIGPQKELRKKSNVTKLVYRKGYYPFSEIVNQ